MENMHTAAQRLLYFLRTEKARRLFYFITALLLLGSIYRDIANSGPAPWDFRNRVVGARMMEDGLSPYFFIWQPGDSVRYYDRIDPLAKVSPATASPFFHWLLIPIASLPQLRLNTLWMGIEYLVLLGTLLISVFCIPRLSRHRLLPVVLVLGVAFTYTIGWRVHVMVGQNYVFIPFLLMACYFFLSRKRGSGDLLGFAICCTALLLIRPVITILFLPFIPYFSTYFKWGIITVAFLLVYSVFVLSSPVQKLNWTDYFRSIPIHMANHQKLDEKPDPNPLRKGATTLPVFEGVSLHSIEWKSNWNRTTLEGECSNLFIAYYKITGKLIATTTLYRFAWLSCIVLMLPLLVARLKRIDLPQESLFLIGFAIYNLFTYCLPATRQPYYWVEFLFPLLLIACRLKSIYIVPLALLLVGLYFNIASLPFIKMRHNIGAFVITGVFLFLAYRPLLLFYFNKHIPQKLVSWW